MKSFVAGVAEGYGRKVAVLSAHMLEVVSLRSSDSLSIRIQADYAGQAVDQAEIAFAGGAHAAFSTIHDELYLFFACQY